MWHASQCVLCATTTDSPACKLGKAIIAASAGSRLRLGDRMNNLHIPCAASVCGQISIWKKNTVPWQANRCVSALHCRALLVYTRVISPLLARAESRFFIYVHDEPSDDRALRLLSLVCSARPRSGDERRWGTTGEVSYTWLNITFPQ